MSASVRPASPLVLSASTLAPATRLRERIEAAAAAGFDGIGLRPSDRADAHAACLPDSEIAALLRDRGLGVVEIQALGNWGLGGDSASQSRVFEDGLYALADALGGGHLIAVGEIEDDLDTVAERFAAVCDRAAEHGLAVAVEFVPWTSIPDAGVAWTIVERAGRPNGGVLVDAWHHFRGANDESLLRAIPPERIIAVHLCDADAKVVGSLLEDARHRRRLPGEGSFDLDSFVRLLDGHGVRCPIGVEVLSDDLFGRSAADAALAAALTARRVLAYARS